MNDSPKSAGQNKLWKLVPLTPEYIESEHGYYVHLIEDALKHPKISNIALSGNYGVGKSSILQEIRRKQPNRIVELSLSTLAPLDSHDLDDSVPKQAATPTNQIQQEIVKQLLYREAPEKSRGSRFRRIERTVWYHELTIATLVGLLASLTFLIAGWSEKLTSEFSSLIEPEWLIHSLVFGASAVSTSCVRWVFFGRLHIKQLSAGAATVTLDDKSMSYFDQYLDEIVYFFEVSKKDIVVFEDIDRFNDSHIFETLRSLNILLNASPQIKKHVRFIYAIKDSIFDRIGLARKGRIFEDSYTSGDDPAKAEVIQANRTKFFDIVIPVVPFITHRSARDLAVKVLEGIDHDIKMDVIDLAICYLPDMRLLKNARNEFVVFRNRIFTRCGEHLNLSETDLFAMMLYKNTYLADFEEIKFGASNLDRLYEFGRQIVSENIRKIDEGIRRIRESLSRLDSVPRRGPELGEQLIGYVSRVMRHVGYNQNNGNFEFSGSAYNVDDFRTADFWRELSSDTKGGALVWENPYHGRKVTFTREDLSVALGDKFLLDDWSESERKRLEGVLAEMIESRKFLLGADMGDLIDRPEFTGQHEMEARSLDSIARELLTDGLAFHLVRSGYINRNFTLYTSTFYGGRVSSAATNFIIHHIDQNRMDEFFSLSAEDVEAVLRERGVEMLSETALYNISILDHLLNADKPCVGVMIRSLARLEGEQARFLQTYLCNGIELEKFIKQFSQMTPRILTFLVKDVDLDDPTRHELVSMTLLSLPDSTRSGLDESVALFLRDHYAKIPALTSTSLGEGEAAWIATLFARVEIRLPNLTPLSEAVRSAFVERNLYEINANNLLLALGSGSALSLDAIREANGCVYGYVLENLDNYISEISGISKTVLLPDSFVDVIRDVAKVDSDQISEIVSLSSEECILSDISCVPVAAWSSLAENSRFPPTFKNVARYIEFSGEIDADISKVLSSARAVTDHDQVKDEEKSKLAIKIISAGTFLPSPKLRADLACSLRLAGYLSVDEIPVENGELFGRIMKKNVIEDNEISYSRLSGSDWATREYYIRSSKRFDQYVTPSLVDSDLEDLFVSNQIDDSVKLAVCGMADDLIRSAKSTGVIAMARFGAQMEFPFSIEVVEYLAENGMDSDCVLKFLKPHLGSLEFGRLSGILESLRGEYSKLTDTGHEKPKIPNTPENISLLQVLKRHEIVSSFQEKGDFINVNKRHA